MSKARAGRAALAWVVAWACMGAPLQAAAQPPAARAAEASAKEAAPASSEAALAAQRAWWTAFTVADLAYLRAHSAPDFSLTLSSGRSHALSGMLDEAATHTQGQRLQLAWTEERVRFPMPTLAVATSRCTESDGPMMASSYRYLTLMERAGDSWRVVAAQSTREVGFTPRVSPEVAGVLADYAGDYRTPKGKVLRVLVRGDALGLVEPSGKELPMEPIGPALFEFQLLSPSNGIVRFAFTRDAKGRVAAFHRLTHGRVDSFARLP
jgi:hypothetical protein